MAIANSLFFIVDWEDDGGIKKMTGVLILPIPLESHKARLYSRYNRALRKDPFLQGKVLFEIEIQPNGKISSVSIKSSELNNDKLERQLIIILRSITFPTEKVNTIKTIWAIDFLPN